MKALRLKWVGQLELVDMAPPPVGDREMLIRTGAAVICTSDLNDIRENPFGTKLPVVMGHEGAGTVVQTGPGVKNFVPGDRIAAHPVHPCGKCETCRQGLGHLCPHMKHFGINMPGTFAEYFIVREDRARLIPETLGFASAALAEPVCVCLEALAQAKLRPGNRLLIIGDGPFGILLARLAGLQNLSLVVLAGHHDYRLSRANGAKTINTRRGLLVDLAKAQARGGEYDAIVVAAGSKEAVHDGLELLKPKGRLVIFAAIHDETPINLFKVLLRELEIVGACNDQDRFDEAVRILSEPRLKPEELLSHRFQLSDYQQAFQVAGHGHEGALKVAFEF